MESILGDVRADPNQQQRGLDRQIQDTYTLAYPSTPRLDKLLRAEISTLNTKHWNGITLNYEYLERDPTIFNHSFLLHGDCYPTK